MPRGEGDGDDTELMNYELLDMWREFIKEWEADETHSVKNEFTDSKGWEKGGVIKPGFYDFMQWLALNKKEA